MSLHRPLGRRRDRGAVAAGSSAAAKPRLLVLARRLAFDGPPAFSLLRSAAVPAPRGGAGVKKLGDGNVFRSRNYEELGWPLWRAPAAD